MISVLGGSRGYISSVIGYVRYVSTLPYVDRPGVTKAIAGAMRQPGPRTTWVLGGLGSGKTEAILRAANSIKKESSPSSPLVLVVDLDLLPKKDLNSLDSISLGVSRLIIDQLCEKMSRLNVLRLLVSSLPEFSSRFHSLVASKPLWAHISKISQSDDHLLGKIATTPSALKEVISGLRLSSSDCAALLKGSSLPISLALLHLEKLDLLQTLAESSEFSALIDASSNVVIECNDALKTVWNITESRQPVSTVEVPDLPLEAVNALFVPRYLSDSVHVDSLYSICGGRIAHLQQVVPGFQLLIEEQKIEDMKLEQRYRSGSENRPSSESTELQVNPLIYKRDVSIRETLISGALKDQLDAFEITMEEVMGSRPVEALAEHMSEQEIRVLVLESVRNLVQKLTVSGSLPLPAGLNPLDISHPVVLALLHANLLGMRWSPFPRIVAASPLQLFLLDTWYTSTIESLSLTERASYNLVCMRNQVNFVRQLEKLGN